MEFLVNLWLPILLSAVALWIASSVFWTVMPHHNQDFTKLPDEDGLMKSISDLGVPPGKYLFPYPYDCGDNREAVMEKYKQGPRGTLVTWGMPNMGRNLGLTLVYFLLIATVTAYVATAATEGREDLNFLKVLQIVGGIGVLVFCSSGQLHAIWFPRRMIMEFVDGIAYGLILGLIFASLWNYG